MGHDQTRLPLIDACTSRRLGEDVGFDVTSHPGEDAVPELSVEVAVGGSPLQVELLHEPSELPVEGSVEPDGVETGGMKT